MMLRPNNLSALLLAIWLPFFAACKADPAPQPVEWNPGKVVEQLRWPLEERAAYGTPLEPDPWLTQPPEQLAGPVRQLLEANRRGDRDRLYRTIEALILEGNADALARARKLLELAMSTRAAVNMSEILPAADQKSASHTAIRESYDLRNHAYEHAMLYLLTGEMKEAALAREILLRFAEAMPLWPLYDKNGIPRSQEMDDPAFFEQTFSKGLWGVWHPLDLAMSQPLLRAYDLLRPTLTPDQQSTIENGLFLHQKLLLERYNGTLPYGKYPHYSNLLGYHLMPLIRLGWVLNRPEFIHESVRHWKGILIYSYSADGYFREVTPAYHRQITSRIMEMIPSMLKGYTDPKGYRDSETGERFENLDLGNWAAPQFERMRNGFQVLAMPDGSYASINDDWPKKQRVREDSKLDQPGLLGASGVAKLGSHGMVAFLQFGGMRGHDHHAGLNLIWFSGGKEVFSDTGYNPIPNSGSTREWHTITASHNTVAVNEKTQLQNRSKLTIPGKSPHTSFNTYPPPTPDFYADRHPAQAALPAAAEFFNQGRLLLWDASRPQVQAMEAEQENAYPGVTSLFRRTIVMVPLNKDEGYLVDIFRIKGGRTHDFFLRGGLDEPYKLEFDLPFEPDRQTLYSYIKTSQSAPVDQQMMAVASYADGLKTFSRLGAAIGSPDAPLRLFLGEAPAIRRTGSAPFSLLRRKSADEAEPLETCFVWVHETTSGAQRVRKVDVTHDGLDVAVTVELDGRKDVILSGLSEKSSFGSGGMEFRGRLAYISEKGSVVFSGTALKENGRSFAPAAPSVAGNVISTQRKDAGEKEDSVLIELPRPPDSAIDFSQLNFALAHFDLGKVIRISIPVLRAEKEGENLRLILAHTPGFEIEQGQVVMTNYPGWRIFEGATVRLDARAKR